MAGRLTLRAVRRRLRWALVVVVVVLVLLMHMLATYEFAQVRVRLRDAGPPPVQRMEVAFVRELVPAAPPLRPPAVPPRKTRRAVAAATPAASAPASPTPVEAPDEPLPTPVAQASAPEAPPEPPSVAQPLPQEAAEQPAAAASQPAVLAFEWPPSTRLTYKLRGNYRGEIHGKAQVQWIRAGLRYQVHLDVWLGPPFAPIVTRRMTSDGELTEAGLKPLRYEEETQVAFSSPRRTTLMFEPDHIVLPNGRSRDTLPGVQDAASQFVQLTWLFTTQPHLLRTGNTVVIPLALPRRVDQWLYDVVGEERLRTSAGEIDTFHVKPRREPKASELTAEMWFGPALQYLPVRILIRQDAETYVDMLLQSRPMQAQR